MHRLGGFLVKCISIYSEYNTLIRKICLIRGFLLKNLKAATAVQTVNQNMLAPLRSGREVESGLGQNFQSKEISVMGWRQVHPELFAQTGAGNRWGGLQQAPVLQIRTAPKPVFAIDERAEGQGDPVV